MERLIKQINKLKGLVIKTEVDQKLKSFKRLNKKGNKEWFSELCFCILTANTSAEMGVRIQKKCGRYFSRCLSERELARVLKKERCRFYNRRAHFIYLANRFKNIKDILNTKKDKREWLVSNIKGIRYKEASHFLRNIGYFDYAILDKHVLNILLENKLIKKIPKTMNQKNYLDIEEKLGRVADKLNISQGELDMYLWFMKTGKVLK